MLGYIGVILSLVLLVFLAYRRWNVIIISLIAALIVGLTNGLGVFTILSDFYMPGLVKFMASWFLVFTVGALYSEFMTRSGSVASIAYKLVDWVGKKQPALGHRHNCTHAYSRPGQPVCADLYFMADMYRFLKGEQYSQGNLDPRVLRWNVGRSRIPRIPHINKRHVSSVSRSLGGISASLQYFPCRPLFHTRYDLLEMAAQAMD
jgi:hypothetical protein